jgi:hypothetical protein
MASPEVVSIILNGFARAVLGTLAVCKGRDDVARLLGLTWLLLAMFNFSLLWKPEWTTWRDMGSYYIFITAMLAIVVNSRYGTPAKTLSPHRS